MIDATDANDGLRGVVAIGASAGGVEALSRVAAGLSPDLPYAYLMVLHIPAGAPSILARIVDRSGPLPATTAEDGAPLLPGHIYVGTPDRHLLVADHRVVLSQGPTENGHRPAINALFRSAAVAFGHRAIGVLLSGVLDDGVLGLAAIRSRGGTTIGQSPEDALFAALPTNASDAGVLDRQSAAAEIGAVLKELSQREIEDPEMEPDVALDFENRIAMTSRFSTDFDTQELGVPSGYTCPDCNGSLISISEGHFRCRVGHAWTADSLLAARDQEIEGALWVALRSLQEKSKLARQLADKAGTGLIARHYTSLAEESERALVVLSDRLAAHPPIAVMPVGESRSAVRVDPAAPRQDVPILVIEGVLDSSTYRSVRDSVIKAALDEPRAVIVDVDGLSVPSASAWTVFTSARWHVSTWPDVPILLVCTHPQVRRAIDAAGVTRYVPVHPSVELALASLACEPLPVRRRARCELPATRVGVGLARAMITDWLTQWDQADLAPVASTVGTVFVENVLDHTQSAPVLVVESYRDTVTVAVEDCSERLPGRHEDADRGAEIVSGLAIVAALCRSWGAVPTTSGKTVWALVGRENQL